MANRGKNMQLVQCWLTKIDTAQHIGLAICTDRGGNIGREKKFNIICKQRECVPDVTSNCAVCQLRN